MTSTVPNRTKSSWFASSFIAGLIALTGPPFAAGDEMVPDFSLLDVNTTSSTYDQLVSPRDYLQQASGWYFGDAT